MINSEIQRAKAFAPATCANVGVGFDILGFALEGVGDEVTLIKRDDHRIVIESIDSPDNLPLANDKNTASLVIEKFCSSLNLDLGFSIHIKKGIPLCSGMGGSAASAVAALIACNAFLQSPLSLYELAELARLGEQLASGEAHADNIIPCLFGGLTLIHCQDPLKVIQLPTPKLYCVLIHPHLKVSTRDARNALAKEISLKKQVQQSAQLASFISALYENDYQRLQQSMNDVIIEPQRAQFVPNFYKIKEAALQAGALGMSFSGSGPALFAFARTMKEAELIKEAMRLHLQEENLGSDWWISPISERAARLI
ncbi:MULTISPECIES: homoserine kinase [Legionella]|uniref:Homoserine kinase n=1 Tax=Legionella drozanskii LLAP-1 TaxID=1212489 RepID=A0A0W0SXJ4_9GAMM|nr:MULTISPECIES: homoserine kinase [Legionella]KTC88020.1 Homoserine kinase [Legionella drozanskii LLAP-1]PJE07344.1 MAG: homoserine kinase [Legionella sp.]